MKITVKTLSGETFQIDVEPENNVAQIKEKIKAIKNFQTDAQKILRKGKVLNDEDVVSQIGMQENDFVVVMVNVKKPAQSQQPQQQQQQQQPQQQPIQAPQPVQQPQTELPKPASQQPTGQSSGFQVGSSAFLVGQELENFLKEVVDMGFTREQGQTAMKAAFNNPERAMDFLLNGIPNQPTVTSAPGVVNPPPPQPGQQAGLGSMGGLGGLGDNPQIQQLRELAQTNPQALAQILPAIFQQISQTHPELAQQLQQNPQLLLQLLMGGAGGHQGGQRSVQINLTEPEMQSLKNIQAFGFSKHDALEAFLACDKNEEYALNYLLERQEKGELLSQHIQNEQNQPNQPNMENEEDPEDDDDDIYQ